MHEDFLYELISAYVDGEVSEDERQRARALLSAHADLRQYHDELLVMRAGLQSLERHQLPAAFAETVLARIRELPSDPLNTAQRSHAAPRSPSSAPPSGTFASAEQRSPVARRESERPPTSSQPGNVKTANAKTAAGGHARYMTGWRVALLAVGSLAALIFFSIQFRWFDDRGTPSPDENQLVHHDAIPPVDHDNFAASGQTTTNPATSHSEPSAGGRPVPQPDPLAEARSPSSHVASPDVASPDVASPDIAASGSAATEGVEADERTSLGDKPTSDGIDDPLVAVPSLETAPADNSALPGIMLVWDVVLSSRGIAEGTFANSLDRAEVPWMNHIPVDAGMEQSLLSSRFFGGVRADQLPLEPTPGTQPEDVSYLQLAFVVARGEQIVETIDQLVLARDVGEVVALRFDIAMGGNESELAVQLQRAMRSEGERPAQPVRAHPLAMEPETQQRLLAALRRVNGNAPAEVTSADTPREKKEEQRPKSPAEPSRWEMFGGPTKFPILFVLRSETQVRREEVRPE
jgi:hypothetical protein